MELEFDWTSTDGDNHYNYDYFRVLPFALHTGPGY